MMQVLDSCLYHDAASFMLKYTAVFHTVIKGQTLDPAPTGSAVNSFDNEDPANCHEAN